MWIRWSKVYVPVQALNDVNRIQVLLPQIPQLAGQYLKNYVTILAFLLFVLYTRIYRCSIKIAQRSYVQAADAAELHPLAGSVRPPQQHLQARRVHRIVSTECPFSYMCRASPLLIHCRLESLAQVPLPVSLLMKPHLLSRSCACPVVKGAWKLPIDQ